VTQEKWELVDRGGLGRLRREGSQEKYLCRKKVGEGGFFVFPQGESGKTVCTYQRRGEGAVHAVGL